MIGIMKFKHIEMKQDNSVIVMN